MTRNDEIQALSKQTTDLIFALLADKDVYLTREQYAALRSIRAYINQIAIDENE